MSTTDSSGRVLGKFKCSAYGVAERQLTNTERWVCFWALFVFGFACVYQWNSPAPILGSLAEEFGMDAASMGWLMSIFNLAGIIVAYPGAWIMRNVGIKTSILITAVLSIIGSVAALAATDAATILAARALQGCAFGLISVIGPNIMPRLFPAGKLGLVMGIWSQWVCPGIALAAITGPMLLGAYGPKSIFVLSLALQVVTTLLVIAFVKMPAVPENVLSIQNAEKADEIGNKTASYAGAAFLVGFCFLAWCTVYPTFNTYYPTFAQEVKGMPIDIAALTTLVAALVTVPTGIVFGIIADRIKQRKWMLVIGYFCLMFVYGTVLWANDPSQMSAWVSIVFLGGICAGLIPTMTRAIIPILAVDPTKTDYALTGMAFVTNVGGFLAAFFGTIAAGSSYLFAARVFCLPLIAVATILIIVFVKNDHSLEKA